MQSKKLPVPGEQTFDLVKGTMREYNKRTKQACDRCRMKKSKCNGGYPCTTCVHRSWTCIYSARKRSDPIRWHSHMQETIEEALQRLYKLCEGAKIFPGELPKDQGRGVTTDCILRAMGFTIDTQPDDASLQGSPHGFSESPTDLEAPDDAMSIFETEHDAWSQSWSASDDGAPASYFEPQLAVAQATQSHSKSDINPAWDISKLIQSQSTAQLTGYLSSFQPAKSIAPLGYHSGMENGDNTSAGDPPALADGQIQLDFSEMFGFDQMLLVQS